MGGSLNKISVGTLFRKKKDDVIYEVVNIDQTTNIIYYTLRYSKTFTRKYTKCETKQTPKDYLKIQSIITKKEIEKILKTRKLNVIQLEKLLATFKEELNAQ